jgi:hypothetical protein
MISLKNSIQILSIIFCFLGGEKLMAYEEPKYNVLKEYEEFEIREYSSYLVAETEVEGNFQDVAKTAHRILFEYISGNNVIQEKMEMTTPVNQRNYEPDGEKIEMTVPVQQSAKLKSDGKFVVSFVVPSKYTMETIPVPKDPKVKIREIPKKIIAARKYSGRWTEENYRENEKILIEEIKKNKLEILSDAIYARYNPPFWPWFLRRNEVLIEIGSHYN